MNPLIQKFVGTLLRSALLVYVAKYGTGIWSDAEVDKFVDALLAVLIVAWGLWEKYQSRKTSNTTLAVMNQLTGPGVPNLTESDITAVIKSGDAAPAATPKDMPPVLHGDGDGMARLKNATARF